jgi:hypothetical protein
MILFLLLLINPINCSITTNKTITMFILTTSSSINSYFKRRFPRHFISKNLNFTDDNITASPNQIRTIDMSYEYNIIKETSSK